MQQEPNLQEEQLLWQAGFEHVAGIDEAGRGAWSGPVVAAAVILPSSVYLPNVRDSKRLTPAQRSELSPFICEAALAWGVAQASHAEIDELSIIPATRLAMMRALHGLTPQPDALLIDALKLPDLPLPQRVLYHADTLCLSVAAASILAKVTRDCLMIEFDKQYPGYHFAQNKGYGVAAHREALARLGASPIHRQTFRPIAEL